MNVAQRQDFFKRIRNAFSDPANVERLMEARLNVLAPVGQRLGGWKLLHGVPFNYLAADERMLPPESLRFFHVDRDWIAALIDGACSPGRRADDFGRAVEEVLMPAVEKSADEWARKMRLISLAADAAPDDGASEITGFILRSQVVSGWKSLGVNAYARGSTPSDARSARLPLLRFERLAPGVLIGLFEGTVYQLDIHEAPQILHFGVDAGGKKSLRYDQAGAGHRLGDPLGDPPAQVDTSFRAGGRRVIEAAKLSKALRQALDARQGRAPQGGEALPSSDFALQMIEGVGMVSFFFDVSMG
jgi:hypothetical protein